MDSLFRNRLRFVGSGADLFGIYIVNLLLSIITLGLYYPWAKASTLQYTYANTQLDDSPFQFHGTGRELFMGFIRAVGVVILFYVVFFALARLTSGAALVIGYFVLYAAVLALIPVAIHGALRYRMSRTSWRGIHFGYRGDRNELVQLYFTQGLLTIITLGIYGAWFVQNINRYAIGYIRFGSAEMRYTGEGGAYFWLNLKGYLFTLLTLGIYGFWWGRDLFAYFVDNLAVEHEGKTYEFKSSMSVGTYAELLIINILLIVFTLGLGAPWATVRSLKVSCDNILLDERLDTNAILQTEADYRDATGEDLTYWTLA